MHLVFCGVLYWGFEILGFWSFWRQERSWTTAREASCKKAEGGWGGSAGCCEAEGWSEDTKEEESGNQ